MLSPNFYNSVFVFPILNLLVLFYKLFLLIRIPGAFGFAIIVLTLLVRLILHPFFKQQMDTARKLQEIKPHLDRLSKKHKSDRKKLQQEQMKIYQQAGINPASGCLFMVIQIPIFIALYNTLSLFLLKGGAQTVITDINKALYFPFLKIQTVDPGFFGFNLAQTPAKSGLWYYYLLPLVTGVLQYLQTQVSTPSAPKTELVNQKTEPDKNKGSTDDFQKAMSTQMKFIFPLMIAWFSYSLPVGLSLYWNIFSLFSIIQYQKINPKSKILNLK